jgi:hypothetical protein
MRGYDRSTIANLTISFGDQRDFEEKIMYGFRSLAEMPKYNISDVNLQDLTLPASRAAVYANNSSGKRSKALTDRLRRLVEDAGEFFAPADSFGIVLGEVLVDKFNIGGLMMYEWAKRNNDGTYPVIQQRTLNSLTVEELLSNTDPAKTEVFAQSLRNNYVIVYDIEQGKINTKVSGVGQSRVASSNGSLMPGKGGDKSVTAIVNAYIYKVDISDELFRTFIRPRFKDREVIRAYQYALTYVGRASVRSTFSPEDAYEGMRTVSEFRQGSLMKTLGMKNKDEPQLYEAIQGFDRNVAWSALPQEEQDTFMINELTRIAFEDVLNLVEMNVEDFKVRTPITGKKPIVAAVGNREGIRADQRYRVYENVLKGDSVVTRAVGVVRAANKVADNMTTRFDENGNALSSEFRQVFGDGIQEGMYMVQENDYGLALSVGPTIGYFGGPFPRMVWSGRGYYNVSRTLNKVLGGEKVFGLSAYLGLGFGSRKAEEEEGSYTSFIYELGVEKKMYLHHRFDLIPEFGITVLAPGRSSGLEAEFFDKGALYLAPGIKGLYKLTERSGIILGLRLPVQIAQIPYDNPASFLHFDLRVRTSF